MNTYLIAGHARLPQGMAARNVYDSLTVTLELDRKHGVIIDADCTLATEHAGRFLQQLLRGYCLKDGIDGLLDQVQILYRGKACQAVQAALKDGYAQFEGASMKQITQ
ncbi:MULTISPECIES: DUF3870 domain-containing protein [unclassified Sporolactobacillus]|uniref:DUF3870 domain-containing protein n=1 Tax=unclassified Sporolactobacillus TaxID=2628533 RepID=UPI00236782F2|nr:DUF3870 domain-containing protein [Sporolactobacillus sp. CQH2019]MDD9150805.1 DUF3870 domain-containing protein [Sporolactobacillus sp. CQH2019]